MEGGEGKVAESGERRGFTSPSGAAALAPCGNGDDGGNCGGVGEVLKRLKCWWRGFHRWDQEGMVLPECYGGGVLVFRFCKDCLKERGNE